MSQSERRLFAIIPAAGHSRRMGRPKLLLPFGETTVIGRLIEVLSAAEMAGVFVLVRPDDEPLAEEVRHAGATVVQPAEPPAEMRVSVEHLLATIARQYAPADDDGWLLIPGDHPLVTHETLSQLITSWHANPSAITLPVIDGRRGHPTLFPWPLAEHVAGLPADVGVNHLLRSSDIEVNEVSVTDPAILLDLDTPDDYERALKVLGE